MNVTDRKRCRLQDPRYYQIGVLISLLVFGILSLDFGVRWQNAASIVSTALAVQLLATAALRLPRFDPLSPLITSLSLTLLLRTDDVVIAVVAAVIAIGSKFIVRFNGKHVFNPANVALVFVTLSSNQAWLSSGQWGSAAIGALALASLGFLVLTRARRAETTIAFLLSFAALLLGRALWLGDPLQIPLHQLQNGALLIFAFFMISDPKTAPNSAAGRILFAMTVATIAFIIQFVHFIPNGPILALAVSAPLVPLVDRLISGRVYHWQPRKALSNKLPAGVSS
jgi:Na+-transporting NADH:ubiquinone oxidoreductase subunit NqrB